MSKGTFCVYCHTLREDGRKYIGITKQRPRKRWGYGAGYGVRTHFGAAIRKYGWSAFDHEILEEGLSEEEAKIKEREYIAKFDTMNRQNGFNLTAGGDGVLHLKFSDETREKLRKSHFGKKQSQETIAKRMASIAEYYKTHEYPKRSEESNMKNALAHIGRPGYFKGKHIPESAKEKIRQANLGKKHTEETKMKMRNSSHKKKAVKMLDLDGNFIMSFSSCQDAMRYLGVSSSSAIAECARGKHNTAYKYKWEYYEQ